MSGDTPWTPGPWFAVPYGDGYDSVICEDEAGNQRIAFMAIPGSRDEPTRRKKWVEIKANARLIAAAPELYDALESLLAAIEAARSIVPIDDDGIASDIFCHHINHAERPARAALAKARGEA